MIGRRLTARFGVALIVTSLGLAACSQASDSPAAPASAESSEASAAASGAPSDQQVVSVKIGLSNNFSGAGAATGEDARNGILLAIEEIEAADPGYDYELVFADDECTPDGGQSAFGQLIDVEEVDVILGSSCSGATLGGKPLLQEHQVPGMTFGASNAAITEDAGVGGQEYQWRMNLDDRIMSDSFAQFIADHGTEKLAILATNSDFGRGAAEVYKEVLPEVGVEVVSDAYFDLGATDLRAQLTAIQASDADAILTFSIVVDCVLMARQMAELGMDLQLYNRGAGCVLPEALTQVDDPAILEGVIEGTHWFPTEDQSDWMDALMAKFDQEVVTLNNAQGYAGMYTLHEAVKAGGPGREGIQAGFAEVDFENILGPIKFDEYNQAHPNMHIVTVEDGEPVLLEVLTTE